MVAIWLLKPNCFRFHPILERVITYFAAWMISTLGSLACMVVRMLVFFLICRYLSSFALLVLLMAAGFVQLLYFDKEESGGLSLALQV